MIQNPYYIAEITSSRCSVEFSLNGVPNYCHFEEANTASTATIEWPINLFICKNELQHFEIKVMPLINNVTILEKALVRVKIFKAEAILEYVPQELVSEEIEVTFTDKKELPFYFIKGTFQGELPFKTNGWENSVDLSKEDHELVYNEVIAWNDKILNIYKTFDKVEYVKVFKNRNLEINKLLYLPQNDSVAFHPKFKDLVALPDNIYKLEFFDDGKLVSVRMQYQLPGFIYEPEIKDEEGIGFSLNIYFHRKEKGMPLEVIR